MWFNFGSELLWWFFLGVSTARQHDSTTRIITTSPSRVLWCVVWYALEESIAHTHTHAHTPPLFLYNEAHTLTLFCHNSHAIPSHLYPSFSSLLPLEHSYSSFPCTVKSIKVCLPVAFLLSLDFYRRIWRYSKRCTLIPEIPKYHDVASPSDLHTCPLHPQ